MQNMPVHPIPNYSFAAKPPCRYSYNPKWWVILLNLFFSCAGGLLMYDKAVHNTARLKINFLSLGPTGANIFYGVMLVFCGLWLLVSLLLLMRRFMRPAVLELDMDALLLPHGLFQRKRSRINYSEIEEVAELHRGRQKMLHITTTGGGTFMIIASLLPDNDTYRAIRAFLLLQQQRGFG
jgi:hypothetical protein